MDAIEFLRWSYGVSKGKTLEETIGSHMSIDRVVKDMNSFVNKETKEYKHGKKIKEFISDKAVYEEEGTYIWGINEKEQLQMLLEVRGWGAIQHLFDTEKEAMAFQDEFGQWVADAINEKLNKK